MEKKRAPSHIVGYDNWRTVATLLVVLGHCGSIEIGAGDIYANTPQALLNDFAEIVRQFIYGFHMPLFVMLSGALFFLSSEKIEYKGWVIRRAKRLLIPYFSTGLLLYLPVRLVVGYYGTNNSFSIIKEFLCDLIIGRDINYLWYLIMLFEVSALFGVLRCFAWPRRQRTKIALLLGLFCLSVSQYSIGWLPFQLHRTCEFLFWFYLGVLFEENRDFFLRYISKFFLFLIALYILSFVFNYYLNSVQILLHGSRLVALKLIKMALRYIKGISGCMTVIYCLFRKAQPFTSAFSKIVYKHSMQIYLYHMPCMTVFCFWISKLVQENHMTNTLYAAALIGKFTIGIVGSLFIHRCVLYAKSKMPVVLQSR